MTKHRDNAEARAELRRKAEAYLRHNPPRGPAGFKLPEQLAIADPESQHYPHIKLR